MDGEQAWEGFLGTVEGGCEALEVWVCSTPLCPGAQALSARGLGES